MKKAISILTIITALTVFEACSKKDSTPTPFTDLNGHWEGRVIDGDSIQIDINNNHTVTAINITASDPSKGYWQIFKDSIIISTYNNAGVASIFSAPARKDSLIGLLNSRNKYRLCKR